LRELPEQPRFTNAGLPDNRHDLPLPSCGAFQGVAQLVELASPAYEPREASGGCRVQT
jgi:hypothetical protein